MSLEEQNKALIREVTEKIWNQRRFELIPQFYSSDYVADTGPHAPLRKGPDGIKGMVERTYATFPDYHEEIRQLIAEGDFVVVRLTNTGTQQGQWGGIPPTGKRVEIDEIVILQIHDGKIVGQKGIPDNLTALRQLGVIPTPRQQ